jgi:peptide/nickel transport system permease protein
MEKLARRLLEGVLVIVTVILITFTLMHLAPGDPLDAIIGDYPVSPEYRSELRARFALDRSLPEQLVAYFSGIARGQLGYSFRYQRSVGSIVMDRLGTTLLLMGTSLALATFVGVGVGIMAGAKPHSWTDIAVTGLTSVCYSLPVFVLGIILILVFSVNLKWLPVGGLKTASIIEKTGFSLVVDVLRHLLLPAVALSARYVALLARITRSSVLEVAAEDYVTVARAKGLPEHTVMLKHIVRNALIPVATVAGLNFGLLLTGSAVLETVFGWPGMGSLMYDAMRARDSQVLQGIFLISSCTVVVVNILTDLVYGRLDPRVSGA